MSIRVVTQTGSASTATISLPKVKPAADIAVNQVLQSFLANERRQRPLAKTRGEIRGGGAKPYRQKGTGRARAGSSRSPLWRGGGITFGPSGESRPLKHVNRKLARTALLTLLTKRAADSGLIVLTGSFSIEKSAKGQELLMKLDLSGRALVVVANKETAAARGLFNLAGVTVQTSSGLTLPELARHTTVVFTETALNEVIGSPNKPAAQKPAKASDKPAAAPKTAKAKEAA